MPEYLTTKEVAAYLRINEKKVYDLISKAAIPASRVGGKWVFDRARIDAWVTENTILPEDGLIDALLERGTVVVQGSDDPLLAHVLEQYCDREDVTVLTARSGSMVGLRALAAGRCHLALFHLPPEEVRKNLGLRAGMMLVDLFGRRQGVMVRKERLAGARNARELLQTRPRIALRQTGSGTHRLTVEILDDSGLTLPGLQTTGPYHSHLEVALAVQRGEADLAVGIEWAARLTDLAFLHVTNERFGIAVPSRYVGHPTVERMLEYCTERLRAMSGMAQTGYELERVGQITMLST